VRRAQGIRASEPRTRRDARCRCRWFPWRDETPAAEEDRRRRLASGERIMRPAPGRSPSRSRLPQQIGSVRVRASDHAPASTTTLHGVAVAVSIGDTAAASAAAGGVHAGPWARFEVSHDEDGDAYDDDEIQTTIALGGTLSVPLKVSLEKRVPLTNTFPGRHFQWDGGSTPRRSEVANPHLLASAPAGRSFRAPPPRPRARLLCSCLPRWKGLKGVGSGLAWLPRHQHHTKLPPNPVSGVTLV
jgi:hypothetical protein